VDQHSQLLDPAEAATAGIEGAPVRAGRGRLIPRSGLTIDGPPIVSCANRNCGDRAVSAARARRYDRWRDMDGTHVPVGARVEQTEVDARMGAPRSRLHARGHVISRGTTRLVVRFDGEGQTVSIRPHLVRVLAHRGQDTAAECRAHHRAIAGSTARDGGRP
jgi:hypothetical protein